MRFVLGLTTEQRDDGLCVVVGLVGLIKAIQQSYL